MYKQLKYIVFIIFLLVLTNANGQCKIGVSGNFCVNNAIEFTGNASGSNHVWNMNNQSTVANQQVALYAFNTPGLKTIYYTCTVAGSPCTDSVKIFINSLPVVKQRTLDLGGNPCALSNKYCIRDSTYSPHGIPINWVQLLIADGQVLQKSKPSRPQDFCFTYLGSNTNSFKVFSEVVDDSGCIAKDSFVINIKQVGSIKVPVFTYNLEQHCDSTKLTFYDTTSTTAADIVFMKYTWGDGSTSVGFSKSKSHVYKNAGKYKATIYYETKSGCIDSTSILVSVDFSLPKLKVISSADSVCIDEKITFTVDTIPQSSYQRAWTLIKPDKQEEIQSATWFGEFIFDQLGPQIIKFNYGNASCKKTIYDTVIVNGPLARIEADTHRVAENEVYQCDDQFLNTVHFINNTKYYHNDDNFKDDDSSYWQNNLLKHNFNSNLTSLNAKNQLRTYNGCINRLWNFGDKHTVKCTTYVEANINVGSNCAFSNEFEPTHYYMGWDWVKYLKEGHKPLKQKAFNTDSGVCFDYYVNASDSIYKIVDTVLSIPSIVTDSLGANTVSNTYLKWFLPLKHFYGPGTFTVSMPCQISIPAGAYLIFSDSAGKSNVIINGPKKVDLKPNNIIKADSLESFEFLLAKVPIEVEMYKSLYLQYKLLYPHSKILSAYAIQKSPHYKTPAKVDNILWENIFKAEVESCNLINLSETDTCSVLKCASKDKKTIAILKPKANGYRIRPLVYKPYCPLPNPHYEFEVDLQYLKPGCTAPVVYVNPDSAASSKFYLLAGNPEHSHYISAGNKPTNFTLKYSPNPPLGNKTVGIVITNGVSAAPFSRPLCTDTFWYHNLINLKTYGAKLVWRNHSPNDNVFKLCKGDVAKFTYIPLSADQDIHDFDYQQYSVETPAMGVNLDRYYGAIITVNQYWNSPLSNAQALVKFNDYLLSDSTYFHPDTAASILAQINNTAIPKYFNFSTVEYLIKNQIADSCGNPGDLLTTTYTDTVITGFCTQLDTVINFPLVRSSFEPVLLSMGFEPSDLSDSQLYKMIWNNVGTINKPSTGSYGCIDTNYMLLPTLYNLVPRAGSQYILHPRDTVLTGIYPTFTGTAVNGNGQVQKQYSYAHHFKTLHNAGYLLTGTCGIQKRCYTNDYRTISSGFYHRVFFTDTILCSNETEKLKFVPNIEYFSPAIPWMVTTGAYWANTSRQNDFANGVANREKPPIWDWNVHDNTASNPSTYNGSYPYGGIGKINSPNDSIPISRFGTPVMYYVGDTQVFKFRSITHDSSGCWDTFNQNIYLVNPQANFKSDFDVTNCRNLVVISDSSYFLEPNKLANATCKTKRNLDISKWEINWGDSTPNNIYTRLNANDPGIPANVGHLYKSAGLKTITLTITTFSGCQSTVTKQILIPGPEPIFKFKGTDSNIIYLCLGDTAFFKNITKKATSASQWKWEFGDNKFNNSKDSQNLHVYQQPGRYLITLTQYDSVFVPPNIRAFCQGTYPADTQIFKMIAIVKPPQPIAGKVKYLQLCPNQNQEFINQSSSQYSTYNWTVFTPNAGQQNYITSNPSLFKSYGVPGNYTVILNASFDPNVPLPHCPAPPDTMQFYVDSVVADFSIDTTFTPKLCYTQRCINGILYSWSFYQKSDITITGEPFNLDHTTTQNTVCKGYEQGGKFYVCLVATNPNGCTDTICKPVELNIQLFLANIFTPGNSDGLNDTYKFIVKGTSLYQVDIYNRWGEHVFNTTDNNYHWNGRVFNTGPECPDGTYFYVFRYQFPGSDAHLVSGTVTIVRDK